MSITLDPELEAELREQARREGKNIDAVVNRLLRAGLQSDAERHEAGMAMLRPFFGKFRSGDPSSADNDKIDRDLAAAYADDHEPEK